MSDTAAAAAPPQIEVRELPLQTRIAPVASVNAAARTFELAWTRGAPVRRFDWATWTPYIEELSLDPAHIRMGRLESGAPLLNTHQQWDLESVLGVIERAWMADSEGMALSRFSRRDDVAGYWQDVADGIIRNVSVGYIVHRYLKIDAAEPGGIPTWRAIDWEPCEISLVPVGADPFAGVRSFGAQAMPEGQARDQLIQFALRAVGGRTVPCQVERSTAASSQALPPAQPTQPQPAAADAGAAATRSPDPSALAAGPSHLQEELPMDEQVQARGTSTAATPNAAAPAQPVRTEAEIRAELLASQRAIRETVAIARRSVHGGGGLDDAFVDDLLARGVTVDQARAAVFERLSANSQATGPQRSAAAIATVQDEQEQRRADMAAAVAHRAAPNANALPETARRYRGYTLFELARRSLEEQGLRTEGLGRNEIVALAMGNSDAQGFRSMHGTSDFTVALASTVSRSLRRGYESAPRTFTRWARMGTLADFRPATRVAVAGNLSLEKVNEFGEFKRGRITDAGEQIQLATFGKVVGVSRQAVINDDLDFLSRLPAMFGRAAADFESDTVYGILTANANMADGVALFHANHGNLAASGGAISEATLSAARLALRQQKDPSGNNQPLNLVGRYIIVPAARETAAQKMFAAVVTATKTDDTNVFQNAYEIVTEPRLDANSATAWYLAADSSQIDTIEYAYLEGEQGLYTEQRNGFDVDGLEVKARLDFAAKATDWRGLYRNPGA